MFISKIVCNNLCCFDETGICIDLPSQPGWYVFTGSHGSGKTSLLRATALALLGREEVQANIDYCKWLRDSANKGEVTVTTNVVNVDWTWGLRWSRDNLYSKNQVRDYYDYSSNPHLKFGDWTDPELRTRIIAFGNHRRGVGHALSETPIDHVRAIRNLCDETFCIQDGVTWLVNLLDHSNHRKEKRYVAEGKRSYEMLQYVIDLLNDGLLPEGCYVKGVSLLGINIAWEKGTVVRNLHDDSDGIRAILSLVCNLIWWLLRDEWVAGETALDVQNVPAVVMIDSPEIHLHPSEIRRIIPWFLNHFPKVQFIVATHDPFVCQSASIGGLFRMLTSDEIQILSCSSPILQMKESDYFNVVNGSIDDAMRLLFYKI